MNEKTKKNKGLYLFLARLASCQEGTGWTVKARFALCKGKERFHSRRNLNNKNIDGNFKRWYQKCSATTILVPNKVIKLGMKKENSKEKKFEY